MYLFKTKAPQAPAAYFAAQIIFFLFFYFFKKTQSAAGMPSAGLIAIRLPISPLLGACAAFFIIKQTKFSQPPKGGSIRHPED
jgi:hypothetical protein